VGKVIEAGLRRGRDLHRRARAAVKRSEIASPVTMPLAMRSGTGNNWRLTFA
jgi:hypothetical protein